MDSSDGRRLSVSLVDVIEGRDAEFLTIATHFEALLIRKDYGRAETIRDEAHPLRYYAVRYWTDATAAERCHRDLEVQAPDRPAVQHRPRHPRRQRRAPEPTGRTCCRTNGGRASRPIGAPDSIAGSRMSAVPRATAAPRTGGSARAARATAPASST